MFSLQFTRPSKPSASLVDFHPAGYNNFTWIGWASYSGRLPASRNERNISGKLKKEKPDLLISSGAAVAVPFFYIAKLMGKKLIYIEVYDRIDKPTLTGRLVYPIVDSVIVQWEEQKMVYKKAVNFGSVF